MKASYKMSKDEISKLLRAKIGNETLVSVSKKIGLSSTLVSRYINEDYEIGSLSRFVIVQYINDELDPEFNNRTIEDYSEKQLSKMRFNLSYVLSPLGHNPASIERIHNLSDGTINKMFKKISTMRQIRLASYICKNYPIKEVLDFTSNEEVSNKDVVKKTFSRLNSEKYEKLGRLYAEGKTEEAHRLKLEIVNQEENKIILEILKSDLAVEIIRELIFTIKEYKDVSTLEALVQAKQAWIK